jgi:nucleolar protein 15
MCFYCANANTAAPVAADSPAKKTKKVEAKAAASSKDIVPKSISKKKESTKPKAEKPAASPKAKVQPTREAKPRKRAADFLTDEEAEAPAPAKAEKKAEKKPANKKPKQEETEAAPTPKKSAAKKSAPKSKKPEPVVESEEEDEDVISAAEESEAEEDAEDDQTAALIKGFESSDDEGESGDEGYKEGQPIPKIPDSKKAQRKLAKQQKANGAPEEPGTVYIG